MSVQLCNCGKVRADVSILLSEGGGSQGSVNDFEVLPTTTKFCGGLDGAARIQDEVMKWLLYKVL